MLCSVSRGDWPRCGQLWKLQWHPICQRQRGWTLTCQSRTPSPDAVGFCWPGFRPNFHFQCAPAVAVVGQIFDHRISVMLPVTFFSNLNVVFQQPSNQHGSHHRSHDVNYVRPSPMMHNPASFHHSLDLVWMHPCTEQIGAVSVSRRVVPADTLYLFIWVPVTA